MMMCGLGVAPLGVTPLATGCYGDNNDYWIPDQHFNHGNTSFDGNGFNTVVTIGGEALDPCAMIDGIDIQYIEGESARATITLDESCGIVDVFKFYNQELQVRIVNDKKDVLAFKGIVDTPQFDMKRRTRKLTASFDRRNAVEELSQNEIDGIGYWCQSVFGKKDEYENKNEELSDRLSTIPASYDFDQDGNGHLSYWKPKDTPDYVLEPCLVYLDGLEVEYSPASSIVNVVNVTLSNQYSQLWDRRINFSWDYSTTIRQPPRFTTSNRARYINGGYVLSIASGGATVSYDSFMSAINSGGWLAYGISTVPEPSEAFYTYFGRQDSTTIPSVVIHWSAAKSSLQEVDTGEVDENGAPIMNTEQVQSDGGTNNLYVMSGSWSAMKRWKQNVSEKITFTIKNQNSIDIHGEKKDDKKYTIKHDIDDLDDDTLNDWGNEKKYSKPRGALQSNGDYLLKMDNVIDGEYSRAFECIAAISHTRMLESHRQNTVSARIKFLPELALHHTVLFNIPRVNGLAKVKNIVHKFDFKTHSVTTDIVGAFYMNPLSDDYTDVTPSFSNPVRPVLPLQSSPKSFTLGNYAVWYNQEIEENPPESAGELPIDNSLSYLDNAQVLDNSTMNPFNAAGANPSPTPTPQPFQAWRKSGYIMKLTGTRYGVGYYAVRKGYSFRVATPDIEKESTDNIEDIEPSSAPTYNAPIPDGEMVLTMVCNKPF